MEVRIHHNFRFRRYDIWFIEESILGTRVHYPRKDDVDEIVVLEDNTEVPPSLSLSEYIFTRLLQEAGKLIPEHSQQREDYLHERKRVDSLIMTLQSVLED